MIRKFRLLLATAVVAAGAATAACGGDSVTDPATVQGTYHLQTVNGIGLPITIFQEPGYQLDVLSAVLTLNANRTYQLVTVFSETEDNSTSESTEIETGTFTVSGATVTLRDQQGFTSIATVSGNTLTVTESGIVLVFVRQ